MHVLVTGATGYIGGRLVPRLLDAGHSVRCLARTPSRLAGRPWSRHPALEVVAGDVLEPASLGPALEGIDAAYYLVHALGAGEKGFAERDRAAAENFGTAAAGARLAQVIYLGGLGETRDGLSPHLESRQATGAALRSAGAPVTEFRAAVIVGSGSLSFEMIRDLVERLPVMITPRWVSTRCQPIAIRDVLAYLLAALGRPEAIGRTFEIGGPDVLSYGEMMKRYAELRGLRRILLPVPVLTPRLSSYWVDLVTPVPAAYARTLVEGMRNEVVVRDDSARRLFAVPPTPYFNAVARALELSSEGEVETDWAASFPHAPRDGEVSLERRAGRYFERRVRDVAAPASAVFTVFTGLGGRRGWYAGNALWHARGFLDRLAGGVGMRRGRRDPDAVRPGDALDFWRVESLEEGRALRLRAEMRVPGRAWLVFECEPGGDHGAAGTRLCQTAVFEPRGLFGLLYWWALYPVHQVVFSGLIDAIARRAERAARGARA